MAASWFDTDSMDPLVEWAEYFAGNALLLPWCDYGAGHVPLINDPTVYPMPLGMQVSLEDARLIMRFVCAFLCFIVFCFVFLVDPAIDDVERYKILAITFAWPGVHLPVPHAMFATFCLVYWAMWNRDVHPRTRPRVHNMAWAQRNLTLHLFQFKWLGHRWPLRLVAAFLVEQGVAVTIKYAMKTRDLLTYFMVTAAVAAIVFVVSLWVAGVVLVMYHVSPEDAGDVVFEVSMILLAFPVGVSVSLVYAVPFWEFMSTEHEQLMLTSFHRTIAFMGNVTAGL